MLPHALRPADNKTTPERQIIPIRMKNLIPTILIAVFTLLARPAQAQSPQPLSERLDAIVAYPLVISLRVPEEDTLRRGVVTRLDDGRTFTSTPYWVGRVPYLSRPSWVTSFGQWEATPYDQIRRTSLQQRPPGSWFIVVPLPIDAVGQGLWFGQTRYELNWLPDPERSLLEADTVEHTRDFGTFWSMHLDEQTRDDPSVQDAIAQLRRDPFRHWRARLLTDGLDPDRTRARETLANTPEALRSLELELSTQSPGIELLNAIARQQEARWQIILGRIWLIDPDTAERMKRSLMRTTRFNDRTLPLWSDNQSDLAQLAHDLLSPFVNDDTRVLRAKAWLETQPRSIAWIIDDQGSIEANTERLLPTLGVISLPSEPGSSLLRIEIGLRAPQLETIPPNTQHEVSIPIEQQPVTTASPQLATDRINLRLGHWSQSLDVLASPVPAKPPFVRIGPLLADWTMSSLINNRPLDASTLSPDRTCLGMLWRAGPPDRDAPYAGWRLYLECATPDPSSPDDAITVWIGPRSFPTAGWRITSDALVQTVAGTPYGIVPQPSVETRVMQDRWIAQIDLPEAVFDETGQLMLGIERTDADGVHSAWPRRMIPGQQEPARLLITPDEFDNLDINAR